MDREIKFKAWAPQEQEMAPWEELVDREYQFDEFNVEGGLVFLQYTGLKDKNGKEIYEGDVMKVVCSCDHVGNMPVVFSSGCFRLEQKYQHDFDIDKTWLARYEVIGNIYENPELLT